MDANVNPIELCGTVAAVIYQNEENGYTVLKLDVDDGSQTMVVGCIPYAVPGESMIVSGNWMTHPAHGQQFKADFAERTMPETADAIYAYLAGRAVRGLVPTRSTCWNTSRKSSARSRASASPRRRLCRRISAVRPVCAA